MRWVNDEVVKGSNLKAGDLVKFIPREGCPDPDYLGLIVKGVDRHGLVRVWWFNDTQPVPFSSPRPWQPEELKVISENKT